MFFEMGAVLAAILSFALCFGVAKIGAVGGLMILTLGCMISFGLCICCVVFPKRVVPVSVGLYICIGVTGVYTPIYLISSIIAI